MSPTWMTRSGPHAAALAATVAQGHCDGSLQAWTSTPFFFCLIRQPVSPTTTILRTVAFGAGASANANAAGRGPSTTSHTTTGKLAVAGVRIFMIRDCPPTVPLGQA